MQTVSQAFHDASQAGIRAHTWGLSVSFDKEYDDDIEFGIWDSSTWDGGDLWGSTEDNPIQQWDYYTYTDYTDRVIDMEWSREIEFPNSVQSALADFTINNYDNYFTPDRGSPIDEYILPKRPLRLYAGYQGASTLQQFVGITQGMPELDTKSKTASFHAMDFLSEMFSMKLTEVIAMSEVTTDVVLGAIFEQFGLAPTQYTLAVGRNRIPFVFFEKDTNAGEAFRLLMQSEGGALWIDETGIIRFEQRLLPMETSVMDFNDSNVEDITTSGDSEIINTVRIHSDIRAVQEFQPIYTDADATGTSNLFIVPANDTAVMEVNLQDPLLSIVEPTLGASSSVSWFTARNDVDEPVTSDVYVDSDELRQNTYAMTFKNDNSFAVEINSMEIWGEPAKKVDEIDYTAYDEDSVVKYGEQVLELDNDLFGSVSNAESLALTMIDAYKEFNGVIEMTVKGDYSLQLGDIITVDTRDISGQYKTIKISNMMRDSQSKQVVKARKYTPREWAFFDVSVWDGPSVWAP